MLWREFRHLLTAFAVKNGTPRPLEINRDPELVSEIERLKAELARAIAAAALISKGSQETPLKACKRVRKPRVKAVPAQLLLPPQIIPVLPQQLSMAELLRSYGHVRD
jgi:hypothetical protein